MIGGCAAVAIAGNVFAADEDISYFNPYASLKAGYAYLSKRNDIKYKGGFAGAVELGVSYDAWRLGLELGYKSNKIKEVSNGINGNWVLLGKVQTDGVNPATSAAAADYSIFKSGADIAGVAANRWGLKNAMRLSKVNALTGMVNVCYDYAMTEAWSIYAGLGLGVAKVSYVFDRMLKNQIVDLNCLKTLYSAQYAELKSRTLQRSLKKFAQIVGWKLIRAQHSVRNVEIMFSQVRIINRN